MQNFIKGNTTPTPQSISKCINNVDYDLDRYQKVTGCGILCP